jgi:type IV pilus assembly protein PilA
VGKQTARHGTLKSSSRGFTLIELMIVIAIMSILVSLAVPAYRDFTIRSKITECLHLAAVPKIMISEFQQQAGRWPADVIEAGIAQSPGGNLSEFCTIFYYNPNEGDFAIEMDVSAIDPTLSTAQISPILSPVINAQGGADWFCTRGFTDAEALKYLPSTCRADNIL